ncbi:tubby-related protein 2, partial [Carlito syrichta]|uniref:Tubby-related protein 2 n=1 Tax=Carlito syrichta TaxID=1868482 RepID=A0A3Q0DNR4_CARSF
DHAEHESKHQDVIDDNMGPNPGNRGNHGNLASYKDEEVHSVGGWVVLGRRAPRKMTVIIPRVDRQNQRIRVQPQNEHQSLLSHLKRGTLRGLVLMRNETPTWSQDRNLYELDFRGRVFRESIENFQILHPRNPERLGTGDQLVLQFGGVTKDSFIMDFGFPLCPLQAFAICLSSFDCKRACE